MDGTATKVFRANCSSHVLFASVLSMEGEEVSVCSLKSPGISGLHFLTVRIRQQLPDPKAFLLNQTGVKLIDTLPGSRTSGVLLFIS